MTNPAVSPDSQHIECPAQRKLFQLSTRLQFNLSSTSYFYAMEFNIDAALESVDFTSVDSSFTAPSIDPHRSLSSPQELEAACLSGDLQLVKKRLGGRSRSNAIPFGSSLYLAIESRHTDLVDFLLSRGAPLGPSHMKAATLKKDIGTLTILMKHGWDLNTPLGWATPPSLSFAIDDPNLIDWFFAHGANPNATCTLDLTPLSVAVQFADTSVIRRFFRHGGSIAHGQLLHYAVRRAFDDYIEVMHFILSQGAPVNNIMYQDRLDSYNLQQAFGLGTPLHDAARLGKLEAARVLLDHGADATIKDSLGFTPLQTAEENQHEVFADFLRNAVI
ncbi:Hypothetical protein R9X50_00413800 [Acrodontium crateriforme]|uniref:Ankyrin repeat protein n=1 Tax=Acrodontium crateriforme TaxID=150365 RepID=A0AAQ3M4R7_9PEZI|nr:Hypothetical protein R9X50_00413800 [Acrodontium crateriforme]